MTNNRDENIKKDIIDELYWDNRIDASKINITVEDGVVMLSGDVPTYADISNARAAAWRLDGVVDVIDNLKVAEVSPTPMPSDGDIKSRAENILEWDTIVDEKTRRKNMNLMNIATFARSQEKTQEWLEKTQHQIQLKNEEEAYVVLRAVLHALRDRLTVNQVIDFGAQLPLLLAGVYYDGWTAREKPTKIKSSQDFISKIAKDLPQNVNPQNATVGVFNIIKEKVTPGEVKNIKAELPDEIESLWDGQPEGSAGDKKQEYTKMEKW